MHYTQKVCMHVLYINIRLGKFSLPVKNIRNARLFFLIKIYQCVRVVFFMSLKLEYNFIFFKITLPYTYKNINNLYVLIIF